MEVTLENCYGLRLSVIDTAPLRITAGKAGIVCVAAGSTLGMPTLVGIFDETDVYGGEKASAGMEGVLGFLGHQWSRRLNIRKSIVVHLDENGQWNHVLPEWSDKGISSLLWQPIKWVGCKKGSEDALVGVFGVQARRVLAVFDDMVASGQPSWA
jgi:hypothetical protein